MKNTLEVITAVVVVLVALYLWVAMVVFQFRNPKANDVQCVLHVVDVLTFEKLEKFQ